MSTVRSIRVEPSQIPTEEPYGTLEAVAWPYTRMTLHVDMGGQGVDQPTQDPNGGGHSRTRRNSQRCP